MLSARSHAARPDVVQGMELDVIASVILGGCSLFGGRGFVLGTLLGSLIIGTLNNGLVLLGVSSSLQLVIKGASSLPRSRSRRSDEARALVNADSARDRAAGCQDRQRQPRLNTANDQRRKT